MISNVYDWFVNEAHFEEPMVDPFYNAYGHDIVVDIEIKDIINEDGEMKAQTLRSYSFI